MTFGGGFSIPQDDDVRLMESWIPVTPEKPIPVKPIPVNPYGNHLQGANWQQLTGISREHVEMGASYSGMTPTGSQIGQPYRNGGHYGYDASLETNQFVNHIPGSYNAGSFTELLHSDGSSWNNYPMTQLLQEKAAFVASANRNLSRSVDMAANTPLIPKLHPQVRNQGLNAGGFLLTNQNYNGSYPSSTVTRQPFVMDFPSHVDNGDRDSSSVNWMFSNQNPCSSSNPLSNGDSSSQICHYGLDVQFPPSYDLNSSPSTEADAASCIASQLQFTTDQAKNLEDHHLSAILKSLTEESASKEKDKQLRSVMSVGDEVMQKHSDELLQNIVESSSAAISDRENDRGIDLNKTPPQKTPKRRKHRPKVIVEGQTKRTPKPVTPKNTESKEPTPGKRKYVRKNVQKESPSQLADVTREATDPNAGKGAKSCRRALNFDLEKTVDENQCKAVGQQEEMQQGNKRTFDVTWESQVTHMDPGTNQIFKTKSTEQIILQNELMVENQIPGSMSNLTPSMNHMLKSFKNLPEGREPSGPLATTKDMHMKNFHVIRRHVDNGNYGLCQRTSRDGCPSMQQRSHAEGIGQDVIRAIANCENLHNTKENINHGGSQLVPNVLSLPSDGQGSKRQYCRTIEETNFSTNQPSGSLLCQKILQFDGRQRNSCTLSKEFSECHKKQKLGNGYLSTYGKPYKVAMVEECLGKAQRKGENNVNSNGFAVKTNHTTSSPYIESNRMKDRQSKGIDKFTSDGYTHSIASGHNFLNQHISSKEHSWQEFAQLLSFSTHSRIETCDQLAPSPLRKSFQPRDMQIFHTPPDNMSAKKQAVVPTVSESVSSVIGKVLQERDASYGYQQSSAKATGLPRRNRKVISIDDIIHQFNGLNLNGRCSKSLEQEQYALVPYKGDGAVVPYEGSVKKRKPRPKVELDPETNRIWNLLMGKEGSGGSEGTDKEKEKYWEEERKVFQGRVESFIARMHLVQGDRRFSKWKGSVVDSVIGVFLTQNVSDHLSSSAFMSLASRFPFKSGNHQAQDKVGTNILVEEPEVCMTSPNDATKWNEEISSQPIYKKISMTLHASAENQRDSETSGTETNLAEAHSQCLEEEFVSSQDSFESSVTQSAAGIRSYSASNSEAEDPIAGSQPNKTHISISTYQQMEKLMFQDFYNEVNGSSLLSDGSKNGHIGYGQLKTSSDCIDHLIETSSFTNLINLDNRKGQVPVATSSNNHLQLYPDSRGAEPCRYGSFSDESISSWPSTASRLNIEKDENCKSLRNEELSGSVVNSSVQQNILWSSQGTPTKDLYASLRQNPTDQQNSSQPRSSNGYNQPSYYSHQREGNPTFQLENALAREHVKHTETFLGKKSGSRQHVQNVSELKRRSSNVVDSISTVNKQLHMANKPVDSHLREQLYSHGQSHDETSTYVSKGRKGKAESEKKNAVDWDILRKQAQANGRKTDRNEDTMDSLDYETLINANVKQISDAIKERGMNNMLAERIQEFLNRLVREHGSIDLEWLRDVPPDKAKDYLLSIRGLGLKSVECVRLLTLHHLAFPVDTNVGRIAVRLGWVPLQPLPESLQLHLLELYPMLESIQKYLWPRLCKLDQLTLYELHYQMITFGKVFCTKSKPNCNACPMRGECRHFASAFASARLALPGPEEKSIVSSNISVGAEINHNIAVTPLSLPPPENNSLQKSGVEIKKCEPIIEEPATPEQEFTELSESDIEDLFYEDPDEIPTIKLNMEKFTETLQNYMQENMELQGGDMSKALVAMNQEAASIPTPKLKNVSRLRTEHQVYELPDSHPLLKGMDRREPDDPSPYLLAIWTPGETANSIQPPESRCGSQEQNKLCNEKTCFSCNSIREENSQTVRGTILIPCRTAMRGSFPLNGTYFQVNEMFADHDSSHIPIDVPRGWIWNLPRRTVYFGTSVSTIFKGLSTEGIQYCFWRGYVCVRGFDRTTRAPRPLMPRLHFPASRLTKTKNEEKK